MYDFNNHNTDDLNNLSILQLHWLRHPNKDPNMNMREDHYFLEYYNQQRIKVSMSCTFQQPYIHSIQKNVIKNHTYMSKLNKMIRITNILDYTKYMYSGTYCMFCINCNYWYINDLRYSLGIVNTLIQSRFGR